MQFGYWTKFNMNNDYNIIEKEKYENYYNLSIGGKTIAVSNSDNIVIDFPSTFDCVLTKKGKTKVFTIRENSKLENRVTELEKVVGNETREIKHKNEQGDLIIDTDYASGLIKRIETLETEIKKLKNEQ